MAMKQRMPWICDEETSFPLPIYPTTEAPIVTTKNGTPYHKDPDDHHVFFPRKLLLSEELNPGGQVVRVSRIQSVRRYYHNTAHALMMPPTLIEKPEQQFGMSVLSLLNFVPRQAINLDGSLPEVVDLGDDEYELLRNMTRVDFSKGYHAHIGKFFLGVMLNNMEKAVDEDLSCQFLEARYSRQKRELGNRILKRMSSFAVEPLLPTVSDLRKKGEIPASQPGPYKTVVTYARKARDANKLIGDALLCKLGV